LSDDVLLARVNSLAHEITLLQLGLAELHDRLESVLKLASIDLARFEDLIRREDQAREEYQFVGDQQEGDDLVSVPHP
jgi:hypothetical protein